MSDFFATSPPQAVVNNEAMQSEMRAMLGKFLNEQKAIPVPAYMISDLPSAPDYPNAIVRIIDNPQGQASSNGVNWISDIDGTNLGAGNG